MRNFLYLPWSYSVRKYLGILVLGLNFGVGFGVGFLTNFRDILDFAVLDRFRRYQFTLIEISKKAKI
jgi:hypothetical protein